MAVADGMPLVWLGRLLGFKSIGRVYGPDLMEYMFSRKEFRELRHFFYGANPSVIGRLRNVLVSRFGEFNLAGIHCPLIRPLGFRGGGVGPISNPTLQAPLYLGRPLHAQTGTLARHAYVRDRLRRWDWRRGSFRLGIRDNRAGAALDPAFRS